MKCKYFVEASHFFFICIDYLKYQLNQVDTVFAKTQIVRKEKIKDEKVEHKRRNPYYKN
jgi:hypothetical protein